MFLSIYGLFLMKTYQYLTYPSPSRIAVWILSQTGLLHTRIRSRTIQIMLDLFPTYLYPAGTAANRMSMSLISRRAGSSAQLSSLRYYGYLLPSGMILNNALAIEAGPLRFPTTRTLLFYMRFVIMNKLSFDWSLFPFLGPVINYLYLKFYVFYKLVYIEL